MNNTEHDLENILRQAPRPLPAQGLKEKLMRDANTALHETSLKVRVEGASPGWMRRWWSVLMPATVSLACAVVLAAQRVEINQLKQSLQVLSPASVAPSSGQAGVARSATRAGAPGASESQTDELIRLRQLAADLSAELAGLARMKAENDKLRAQIAAASNGALTAEEVDAVKQARERAMSIQCVNNLKQIGLAVRVWALDNSDIYPTNFLCMSNELGSTRILVCPADTNRIFASDFRSYTDANCSYELFSGSDKEPNQVLSRCPIHGNIGLCDGSVQQGVAKRHPEFLFEENGKLYMKQQ